MNRRKLGPPPSWIPADRPQTTPENADAADPLQNIFSASRSARLGESADDDGLLDAYNKRKETIAESAIMAEANALLAAEKRKPTPFVELLVSPSSNADVRDVRGTRLVILSLLHPHSQGNPDSVARRKANAFLSHYGVGPRRYRNSLLFAAADTAKVQELLEEIRSYLAWRGIVEQPSGLEPRLVERARLQMHRLVERRELALREAYSWLLAPVQPDPGAPVEWREVPLSADNRNIAEHAASTLAGLGLVRTDDLGLAEEIDSAKKWLGEAVLAGPQLVDEFARQLYLPRLIDERILLNALQTALAAGIKPRSGASGPKRLYSATVRLDPADVARIAPELVAELAQMVNPGDLKLTLGIDALVPDATRAQLDAVVKEQSGRLGK